MSNRIKSSYNGSVGDSGYSLLLDGYKLPKDHPSCLIYAENEWLIYSINKFLLKYKLEYNYLDEILNWLKQNIFSISSFCFMKGNSDRHALPIEFLDELETAVALLSIDEKIGEAADFVIHNTEKTIALDGIRIIVRDTERAYTTWRSDPIVNEFIINTVATDPFKAQKIVIDINSYSAFLNRLSKFIWLATRKEALLCGEYESQQYWKGGIN